MPDADDTRLELLDPDDPEDRALIRRELYRTCAQQLRSWALSFASDDRVLSDALAQLADACIEKASQ